MSWEEEQARFWGWITRPQDLSESAEDIAALLAPHSHLSQAEALSIYNNAYHQRLVDVSSALFPILYNSLGKDLYTRLWIGYMGQFPPRNGPIHRVGGALRDYLQRHEQFRDLPAVADIVQLESLLTALFDKADEVPFTLAMLQALPPQDWPAMRWQACQDWALVSTRFDLETYWRLMQEYIAQKGEPGDAPFGIGLLEPAPDPAYPNLLVFRRDHRMQFQRIPAAFGLFLRGIQQDESFAALCESLAAAFPEQDTPTLSLGLLLKAIELGLLRAQSLPAA